MCILFVYTLLKVVHYYDLSVLSMSVMGFQKQKSLDGGWVGGVSSIQVSLDFLDFFNFAKPLNTVFQCSVEGMTLNQESLGSNTLSCCFDARAFSLSSRRQSSLEQLYK